MCIVIKSNLLHCILKALSSYILNRCPRSRYLRTQTCWHEIIAKLWEQVTGDRWQMTDDRWNENHCNHVSLMVMLITSIDTTFRRYLKRWSLYKNTAIFMYFLYVETYTIIAGTFPVPLFRLGANNANK